MGGSAAGARGLPLLADRGRGETGGRLLEPAEYLREVRPRIDPLEQAAADQRVVRRHRASAALRSRDEPVPPPGDRLSQVTFRIIVVRRNARISEEDRQPLPLIPRILNGGVHRAAR